MLFAFYNRLENARLEDLRPKGTDRSLRQRSLCNHRRENIMVILSSDLDNMWSMQYIHIWINAMDYSQPMDLKFHLNVSYSCSQGWCIKVLQQHASSGGASTGSLVVIDPNNFKNSMYICLYIVFDPNKQLRQTKLRHPRPTSIFFYHICLLFLSSCMKSFS
ncbi:uncharacterized protein LOC125479083 [Pyrus x bretschneideri]|uniref:uncharacterized protein LOC125479083 n=1 Tax=Pyrus x bretschneideri TaxID=225117 RepID=UPI00202FD3F4|nr:uncharacterized protein LOC125479083 [Pyrus x bretschneideri]